jgi:hypothetical protein
MSKRCEVVDEDTSLCRPYIQFSLISRLHFTNFSILQRPGQPLLAQVFDL